MALGWCSHVEVACGDQTPIRKLSLAGCKLDAAQAFHGFTLNAMTRIEYLNVSRNKLPAKVAQNVVAPVAYSSATLNQLYISNCDLDAESAMKVRAAGVQTMHSLAAAQVLINIASNERLSNVVVDLSGNKIGKKAINGLRGIFVKDAGVQNIRTLDLSDNDLYPTHLPEVLVAMRKSNVQVLSIGKGRSNPVDDDYLLECLRDNVLGKLRVLRLQGFSKTPEILMRALQENTSIVELDLSDYGLGDSGALLLAMVVRYNSTLQSLCFDSNGIMMNGYMALRDAMRRNNSIKYVGYPYNDIKALQKTLDLAELAVLRSLWMDMEVFVRRNGGGWGNTTYRQFEVRASEQGGQRRRARLTTCRASWWAAPSTTTTASTRARAAPSRTPRCPRPWRGCPSPRATASSRARTASCSRPRTRGSRTASTAAWSLRSACLAARPTAWPPTPPAPTSRAPPLAPSRAHPVPGYRAPRRLAPCRHRPQHRRARKASQTTTTTTTTLTTWQSQTTHRRRRRLTIEMRPSPFCPGVLSRVAERPLMPIEGLLPRCCRGG